MELRGLKVTTLILMCIPGMATALEGISQDTGDLRKTIVGTFLARNVGAETLGLGNKYIDRLNNETLQRLLELTRFGRAGPFDNVVNEAVANQEGYDCPTYDQLPLRMEGCQKIEKPTFKWKSVIEVRDAAEKIGFTCNSPAKKTMYCKYRSTILQHPIKYLLLPSVDGVRSGPDIAYDVTADMHFEAGDDPVFKVTEKEIRP